MCTNSHNKFHGTEQISSEDEQRFLTRDHERCYGVTSRDVPGTIFVEYNLQDAHTTVCKCTRDIHAGAERRTRLSTCHAWVRSLFATSSPADVKGFESPSFEVHPRAYIGVQNFLFLF